MQNTPQALPRNAQLVFNAMEEDRKNSGRLAFSLSNLREITGLGPGAVNRAVGVLQGRGLIYEHPDSLYAAVWLRDFDLPPDQQAVLTFPPTPEPPVLEPESTDT